MKRHLKTIQELYRDYEIDLDRARSTLMSYKALMDHCDCRALEKKIFEDFVLTHNPKEADTEMDEDNMLELLELYMDMVENRMKSYTALENRSQTGNGYSAVENDREFSDDKLTEDTAIVDEVIGQYNDMKSELEP